MQSFINIMKLTCKGFRKFAGKGVYLPGKGVVFANAVNQFFAEHRYFGIESVVFEGAYSALISQAFRLSTPVVFGDIAKSRVI
jgi:hypothetical protein